MAAHPATRRLRHPRHAGAALAGLLLVALGSWAAAVALVGSTFSFDFAGGGDAWRWDDRTWQLSIVPGAAAAFGGLLLLGRSRSLGLLGSLIALVAGAWLALGPFAHDLWAARIEPEAATDEKRLLLWIGWYVGVGVATTAVAAWAAGLLAARRVPATAVTAHESGLDPGPATHDGSRAGGGRDGEAWPVAEPLTAPVSDRSARSSAAHGGSSAHGNGAEHGHGGAPPRSLP